MNADKITAEEMVIIDRLKQMKMSGMAEAYEEQLLNPNIDLTSFFTRFSNIVNFEWELLFLCVLLQETCDSLREKIRAL